MIDPLGGQAWLLLFVFGGFFLDWMAIGFHWKRLKPITKPMAMLILILWTFNAFDWSIDLFAGLLIAAQFFGLWGDIFLLFAKRWFKWGLVSFLFGHFSYLALCSMIIAAQLTINRPERMFFWIALCAAIWITLLVIFYPFFGARYKKQHGRDALWIPIQFYFWILSGFDAVSLFAVLIAMPLPFWMAIFLPLGAALFLLSDFLLATNRFIHTIKKAQLIVRITYHLAQVFLAIGVIVLWL